MIDGLIGIKVGMTQIFDDNGTVVPVTVIKAGPCIVVQKKMNVAKAVDTDNRVERGVRLPVATVIPSSGVRVRNVRAVRQDVRRLSRKRVKHLGRMMFRVPRSVP